MKEIDVPFDIPESWEWTNLETISTYIQRGKSPKYVEKSSVPVVSQKSIQWRGFDLSPSRFLDEKQLPKYDQIRFLCDQDLLWCSTGKGTVGRIGIFTDSDRNGYETIVADSHVTVIRHSTLTNPHFTLMFISSPSIQNRINELTTGSTKQTELGLATVKKTLVPLPPVEEQKRIFKRINEINVAALEYSERYQELENLNKEFPEKLRKSILQYAMQGKLVAQDPNDEPVEVLLEKIRQEKQKLFNEGKLKKKDLQESIIYKGDDNSYYENQGKYSTQLGLDGDIPSVWEFVKFKDYLQLISGRDLKSTEYKDNLSGASLYITGASNFQNGTIVTYRTTDCPSVISLKGDLLITVKGTIGEMAYNSFEEAHIARQIMAIRPYSSSENLEFVRLFLTSEISKIQAKAQSMIPGISRDVLLSLIVPLPPLQEQSKIVKRVSELSSLIEQFSVQFLLAR